jgi:bacterioferritin (cytochrome b1)
MVMKTTARERWLLNFYRNSELHGALLMGRLARSFGEAALAANLTRHCATEARHAAMLTEAIHALGGPVDLDTGTIQERYGDAGGRPVELLDLLVLSEILEKRVLASYRAHLARPDVQTRVRATLDAIVREMEAEEDGQDPHAGWIDRALDAMPADAVARAKARWGEIDARVAHELIEMVDRRFAATDRHGSR